MIFVKWRGRPRARRGGRGRLHQRWHRGLVLRLHEPADGLAYVLTYGDRGWALLVARLYDDDAAAIGSREEPAWRAWMEERFPSTQPAAEAGRR